MLLLLLLLRPRPPYPIPPLCPLYLDYPWNVRYENGSSGKAVRCKNMAI